MAYLVCHPKGGVTLAQTRPDKGKLYAGVFFCYSKVHGLSHRNRAVSGPRQPDP